MFTGTYEPITTMYANGYYAMDGGKLKQCDAPESVRRAYDLMGRRVTGSAKGISIMDGKKIIK